MKITEIKFPKYQGLRCLMMPYIQGDPDSVPQEYQAYSSILEALTIEPGLVGYLTIDESPIRAGIPHRGARSRTTRALHTEAGILDSVPSWGGGSWGGRVNVTLDPDTQILLTNSLDNTCAVWEAEHKDTSSDGDIGYASHLYPYEEATYLRAGDVHQIGIFTPHESLPVKDSGSRQFLRILSKGVHGRESYFTLNPLVAC